jgi:CheY-like chemotaxis protein
MNSHSPSAPHLLLIEDDAGVRRSLQLLLQGQGYQVHSFANAASALTDSASMTATHLVVDFAMPDCDGVEALRALRAAGWRGIAVLITAFYSDALRSEALQAGFTAVLSKPFRDDVLLDALSAVSPVRT